MAGGSYTHVRLDRALGSVDWMGLFPQNELTHLSAGTSDHKPIRLCLDTREQIQRGDKQFRYELMWKAHDGLKPTVVDTSPTYL